MKTQLTSITNITNILKQVVRVKARSNWS